MSRIVKNNIIYSSGNEFLELVSVLPAGESVLIFESPIIKTYNTVDVYPERYVAQPEDEILTAGELRLTFEPQEEDMQVKVRLS